MTRCASTFFKTQCQEPAGHDGDHYVWDSSTHITTWDELAADCEASA
jgi:hypothetical protein